MTTWDRIEALKDEGSDIIASIKAKFQNFFDSTSTTELGKEMWAYVPFSALPYLKYFGNSDYCHIYYADLSVRLVVREHRRTSGRRSSR